MTTARPQHMSSEPDQSDDLIAELAKLMAQEAQGERPVEQAAQKFSGPALDHPRNAPAPGTVPEPFADWRERVKTKSAGVQNGESRQEPSFAAGAVPRLVVSPSPHTAQAVELRSEDLDFDFGLQQTETVPHPAPSKDAIADLIAAEMGSVGFDQDTNSAAAASQAQAAPAPEHKEPQVQSQSAPEPQVSREDAKPASSSNAASVRPFTPVAAHAAGGGQAQPARPVLRQLKVAAQPRSEQSRPEQPRVEHPPVHMRAPQPPPLEPQHNHRDEPPEIDSFAVAPVFGLTSRPAPDQTSSPSQAGPARGNPRDPLQEIENLIGEAVRVNIGDPEREAMRNAPASSILARMTGRKGEATPPSRQQRSDVDSEAAILAAAAVSGLDVGRVEQRLDEDDIEHEAPRQRRRGGFRRQLVGPLVAATLLAGAGFGLYSALGLGQGGDGGAAPLLTAEAGAVKEEAIVTPSASAGQRSAVLDQIDGVGAGQAEQLVSREEVPTEAVASLEGDEASEEGLANRKVRTVTVRPDGTIVNGDTALAASELLPVDRPNVPEVPGATVGSTDLLTGLAGAPLTSNALTGNSAVSAATEVGAPQGGELAALGADATTTGATNPVSALTSQPAPLTTELGPMVVVDVNGNVLEGKVAPVPMPAPRFRTQNNASIAPAEAEAEPSVRTSTATSPVNALIDTQPVALTAELLPSATETAAPELTRVASTEVATSTPATNAAAYVQLSSQRTEADAKTTLTVMKQRYGDLFAGADLEIQRSDLGDRGVYYRVRLPADSARSAKEICSKIQAKGGDCFAL